MKLMSNEMFFAKVYAPLISAIILLIVAVRYKFGSNQIFTVKLFGAEIGITNKHAGRLVCLVAAFSVIPYFIYMDFSQFFPGRFEMEVFYDPDGLNSCLSVFTKEELEFLINFIDNELDKWAEQDSLEDDFFKEIRGSNQLPGSSKKRVKSAVMHYINELKEKGEIFKINLENKFEKAQHEIEKNDLLKISMTDLESRFMKSKKGRIELSYNVQITTEGNGFILANDVCDSASDTYQLQPMVNQTEQNLDELPKPIKWSFDKSYYESYNIKFLNDKEIDGYIPNQIKKIKNPYDKSNFTYNEQKDEYICPEKKSLIFFKEHYDKLKNKKIRKYRGVACKKCLKQKYCTKTKDGTRIVKMYPYEKERKVMNEKMQTSRAKEIFKLRKEIVEPVFGDIKENKGITSVLTRGLKTVKNEFNLISTANNISRMHRKRKEIIQGNNFNTIFLFRRFTLIYSFFNCRTAC